MMSLRSSGERESLLTEGSVSPSHCSVWAEKCLCWRSDGVTEGRDGGRARAPDPPDNRWEVRGEERRGEGRGDTTIIIWWNIGSSPLRPSWIIPATPLYSFITRPLQTALGAILYLTKKFPISGCNVWTIRHFSLTLAACVNEIL